MKREKKILIFLLALACLIIVIWVGIYFVQYRNGQLQIEEERYHNLMYMDLLSRAIRNNIYSTEKIEDLFYRKLEEAIKIVTSHKNASNEKLKDYADIMQLDEISIVDENNNIISSNYNRKKYEYQLELLKLRNGESIILSLPSVFEPEAKVMMYVLKLSNRYFLSSVKQSIIREFVQDISLNALIDFATETYRTGAGGSGKDIHIKYIVIQDSIGILAATDNIKTISKLDNDRFLSEVIKNRKSASRFIEFEAEEINETILPFELDDYDFGVIRMGTHMVRLRKAALRRKVVLISFSLIFVLFLLLEYLVYRYFKKYKTSIQHLNQAVRFQEIASLGGEVAHEIKNPLNALNMILQRLRSEFRVTDDKHKFNNLLEISSNELKRLNNIIEKFLNYSKLEVLNREEVYISDLIGSVVELYKEMTKAEGILISTFCSPDLKFKLDPQKLKQVLINLIKNSLEALTQKKTDREIVIVALLERKRLIIKLRDNGKGIDQEQIDKVWDLYYTTKKDGSGIGLSFSRKIVEAHGGNIELNSDQKGTEVIIVLPEMENE